MDADNLKNRKVIEPIPFKNVHVLAYDFSLRDTQGMNYQLLHHALTAAANQYEKQHPFLRQLADAVESRRQTPDRNKAGLPLISLMPENFRQCDPKQSSINETVLLADLLDHLQTLDPELKRQFDKLPSVAPKPGLSSQTAIRNILRHEFRRQYQRMLTQNPFSQPTPPLQPLSNPATMMFTPDAHPLLDKLRRPENFVLLRSDSPQGDVEKAINRQGWAHYFDAISGASDSSASKNNQSSEVPSESALQQNPDFSQADIQPLLSKRPYLEKLAWHLWDGSPNFTAQTFIPTALGDKSN